MFAWSLCLEMVYVVSFKWVKVYINNNLEKLEEGKRFMFLKIWSVTRKSRDASRKHGACEAVRQNIGSFLDFGTSQRV